ncbi:hypothetical protein TNIN_341661 [Trichonephila inaurata madagascariensis]|uniref:Uncharacterized protein n=1 Tax=Trichonephila inaurata madagascariensis TaxID=2747483 RepID=A0A8X7CGS5_9ARAC|nr:hypothetical protein TNIN_341661 [Trichonephila inaurata madagascariensis]
MCRNTTKEWLKIIQDNIPNWRRPLAVATLLVTTGHDCLAAHLFRLPVQPSPTCSFFSNCIMDRDHLRRHITFGKSETERYWFAVLRMGE